MNENPPETEIKTQSPPPPKRRSFLSRLWRWGLYLVLFLIVLVIGLGVGLKYFFPFERLQPILEEKLSEQVNMPVKIGGLDLDLLNGISIRKITLGHPQPVFGIDKLVLDYDLTELLQGKLTIDQIQVDHPQAHVVQKGGIWNFQPLLELGGGAEKSTEEPVEEPESPLSATGLPPLPIAVDLKELTLNHISASARLEDDLAVDLEGLTLEARGSVDADSIEATLHILMSPPADPGSTHNITFTSHKGDVISIRTLLESDLTITAPDLNRARVSGTLGVRNNSVRIGDPLPAPDLSLQIDGQADMKAQTASLKQLNLHLGRDNSIQLTASVERFLSDPQFQLTLSQGRFNIGELLQLAKKFVPPLAASGHLLLDQVQVQGSLQNNQPQRLEMKQGTLQLQQVFLDHPDSKTQLVGLDAKVALKNVKVDSMTPQHAEADVHLVLERGNLQPDIQLKNLDQRVTVKGQGKNLQKARVNLRTRLGSLQIALPEMGTFQTAIALDGKLEGNVDKGNFNQVQLDLALGSMLSDSLQATAQNFGKTGFNLTNDLKIDLNSVRPWIPQKFLEPLGLQELEGQTSLHARVQGTLDTDFQPQKIQADTKLALNHLNAVMTEPSVKVDDLNLQAGIPAEYDPVQGVFVPQLDLKAGWKSVHALGTWDLGPMQTSTSIQTDRFIPVNGDLCDVSLNHHSQVKVDRIVGRQPSLDLQGLELELRSQGRIHSPEDVRNLDLKGKLTLQATSALNQIKAGLLQTDVHVQMSDLEMTDTRVETQTVLQSPFFQQKEMAFQLESIALKTKTRQNLKTGDITVANIHLDLPGVLDLKVNGSAQNWGDKFAAKASLTQLDFGQLFDHVPDSFKENLEGFEVSGQGALHVQARGSQPTAQQLKKLDLPLKLHSQLEFSDLGLSLPGQGLQVKGLSSTTRLEVADNVIGLKGTIDFGQVSHEALPEGRSLDPRFQFNYVLDQWNRLEINETVLHINGKKIGLSLKGDLEGLRPFLTKKRKPAVSNLLDRLDVRLSTRLAVDAAALQSWVPDISANGRVESGIDTTLTAGQEIRLAGNIAFKKFNARYGEDVAAKNINGKLVFDKRLILDRNLLADVPATFAASRKGYFNQLRDFSEFQNIFKVESLEAGGHRVSNLGLDIFFKDNRLFIEKFLLQTLGASVGGNMFLTQSEQGPELSFNTEFANLDFNALVPDIQLKSSRDTQMDGNLSLDFKIGQGGEGERINLDQLALQVNITRIGKEALDRILLFLDPDESKPAIVDTRSKLQLASPHRVRIELENGNLSVGVTLYNKLLGGIIKAPELKRIPITRLKHFKDISRQLQILAQYQELLQYLAARGIEFDEEENPIPF